MKNLIKRWHSILDMPKRNLEWHQQDVYDEMNELEESREIINMWSELSDVVYTYTRAQWSGHKEIKFPLNKSSFYVGLLYMFPKYTLRWGFYRILGKKFDKNLKISEVRNPQKIEKLDKIAKKYNLEPLKFRNEVEKLKKKWVFLR